jgi:hypothetical protein
MSERKSTNEKRRAAGCWSGRIGVLTEHGDCGFGRFDGEDAI